MVNTLANIESIDRIIVKSPWYKRVWNWIHRQYLKIFKGYKEYDAPL